MFGELTIEPSLGWLLQPLTVETFLDEIWAKTHYHVKRCRPGYFDTLLSGPPVLDELLKLFHREPSALRLVREKDKKAGDSYRLGDGSLDILRVRNDFADGYTIVMDGIERYVRAIGSLSRSIEVELNFPVQVNAYISPPESQGLVPHYDGHDVLILQIQGSKTWHLYEGADVPLREMQREKDNAVPTEGLPLPTDLHLEAGDALYLPRGRVHAAETDSEPSMHLTVGIHAPTLLMLAIGALYSQSFHDDRLNASLPARHLDDAQVRETVGGLMCDAFKTVADPTALAGGLDALADVLVRRGQCPPIGPVSNAARIDGQTLVKKYQPLYSRVKAVADRVELQFATLSVGATADHKAAMQFISASSGPFRVGDLPELTAQQQLELARSLIVSGFLVPVSD
ncbi:cupin domain-containing protein [Mycobacterium sp. 852002-40037_SCH5390672]|uniref:cupin domain-containing protein n=1 Tax=Mycobacterium sp. 852002-40037_SCH5390672 TaxID=1834089 RepID=UPI0008060584|nr:cupin domain-containing protein [Mycobacterium sp. 852002-40037_SCH5390672]OBB90274.1 cupin [Mycobacterium sp. 852002-40037_SCH5390672]